jgi:hypothetical protein
MAKSTPEAYRERRISLFEERLKCLTIGTAKREVARHFQRLVRVRALDDQNLIQCVLCGVKHPLNSNKMDSGHFYSRRHAATMFDFRNCHPCCVSCNKHKGGNLAEYQRWMTANYTQLELADLHAKHLEEKCWTRRELAELKFGFMEEIKKIESKAIINHE